MITVGIPAYNAAATLPALLDSLLAQQYPRHSLEIIVADNGSVDDTDGVVRRCVERGPVRMVQALRPRGPAAARNAVIAAAKGDVIAFTDADCITHPLWLSEIQAGFEDSKVGCVAGAIQAADPETPVERFYARRQILSQERSLAHPFLPYAQTANAAFRREVFRQVGVFDERLITSEDADLLWRMQLETEYELHYRPEALVWHKHRSSARGLFRQTVGWGTGHALVYKKYSGRITRDSWGRLFADYRRILALAALSLRQWIALKRGRIQPELLEETYLSLLFFAGAKLGRWKGSLAARVFFP